MSKGLLNNRKRTSEMSQTVSELNQSKKEELLSLKLQTLQEVAEHTGALLVLPLEVIQPDPHQPRKTFKHLETLAKSIKEQGLLQPIVVKHFSGNRYQIIVGERRFRAAELAGLTRIPAIVRQEEDADTLILQLLENDQRDQVSPLEEAEALQKLIDKMKLSKQQIAEELGRDAAWISLRLGLLQAHPKIKALIVAEKVQDLRTLHELRKLSEEDSKLFETVLRKMQDIDYQGGYRNLIRETRKSEEVKAIPQVLRAEYQKGSLMLYLKGKRKPVVFVVDQSVLTQLSKFK